MTLRASALAATLVVAAISFTATAPAQAQLFDGWFSPGGTPTSRQVVSFPSSYEPGQIIVSFGDRRLYHIVSRGQAISYPIAVPRPQSRWQGVLRISQKRVNPTWTPTAEMRRENPKLPDFVPGGHPMNPLGKRALYLGNSLYRIHGTDAPWTIGQNVSKGCVRMHNNHVAELYNSVSVGTKVTATWQKFNTGYFVGPQASGYGGSSSSSTWPGDQPSGTSSGAASQSNIFGNVFPN